jgi:hypothetical protein
MLISIFKITKINGILINKNKIQHKINILSKNKPSKILLLLFKSFKARDFLFCAVNYYLLIIFLI